MTSIFIRWNSHSSPGPAAPAAVTLGFPHDQKIKYVRVDGTPGRTRSLDYAKHGRFRQQDMLWLPSPYNRLGTFHRDNPGDLESSGKARLMSEWRDKRCCEYKQPHTVLYALPVLREVAPGDATRAGEATGRAVVDLHLPISAIPSVHTRKGYVVGKDAHMRDQPETVQRRVMNLGTLKRVKNPNAAPIIRIKTLAQQHQPQ